MGSPAISDCAVGCRIQVVAGPAHPIKMRATKQLTKLTGLLSARPISPDSYKLNELLTGLDAERKRLGQRRFAVVLNQQVYDYDGLTDFFFLIDSFDTQRKAMNCVDRNAAKLRAGQLKEKLY